MIRRWFARLVHVDWQRPWTAEARGGGPALDRDLEERIRRDERTRVLSQANTAHGQPAVHLHRLSDVLYPKGTP